MTGEVRIRFDEGRVCKVCGGNPKDGMIFNRATRVWHHGGEWGVTCCGKDATRENWWWPW